MRQRKDEQVFEVICRDEVGGVGDEERGEERVEEGDGLEAFVRAGRSAMSSGERVTQWSRARGSRGLRSRAGPRA